MTLKRSLLHIILLLFLTLFILSSEASALSVQVQPEEVHPGDVFILKLNSGGSAAAAAEFLNEPIEFQTADSGMLIAVVPVDIKTAPKKYRIRITHGEKKYRAEINVVPFEFRTIHLTVSEEKVTLSPESQRRVDKEYALQKKIWDRETPMAWSGQFTKPTGTEISTEYGVKRIFNKKRTSIHRGMDFRGKTGAPVTAVNSGTVVLSQDLFYGGNTLVVDHGMGLYSVYMHLSEFKVREGDKVIKEQVVGFVGSSGRATGPHLHLSVKLGGLSVNPESLFKLKL
jgi:murein DD-endopeptidase MepM/ murein hydrolase activator NlpD